MIRNIIFSFSFRVRDYDICHFQLSALSLVTRKFRQLVYTNSRKRFFLFVGHSGEKRNRKKRWRNLRFSCVLFLLVPFVSHRKRKYSIWRRNDAPFPIDHTHKLLLFGVHHKTSCYLCHFLTCCFPYLKSCCWRWRSVGWEIPHGERNRENKPPRKIP